MTRSEVEAVTRGIMGALKEALAERFGAFERRITQLEERPEIKFLGPWTEAKQYAPGDCVQFAGSMWIAKERTHAKPGESGAESRAWQLAVRRGKGGRDTR